MTEARRLLLSTNLPVAQIATRVGFSSSTQFVKMFRSMEGMTRAAFASADASGRLAPDRDVPGRYAGMADERDALGQQQQRVPVDGERHPQRQQRGA